LKCTIIPPGELITATHTGPLVRRTGYALFSKTSPSAKKADEVLRESEAKYRALIETTDTGFVILDGSGNVLDANAEYVRLAGYGTLDEISGRSVREWTALHDGERNMREINDALNRGS